MKKLMTMLAAAAMAFGLYAADEFQHQDAGFVSGTSFEAEDGGTSGDITDKGWWTAPAAGEFSIAPTPHGLGTSSKRPLEYRAKADGNVLNLKTTLGNPAELKSSTLAGGWPLVEGDFYFDGLVNMTVFDEEPAMNYTGTKIAVYAQEVEAEEGKMSTNFVVVAKAKDSDNMARWKCANVPADLSGWHRLTIKAIGDIGTKVPGFVVFIDREAVECEAAKIDATGLDAKAAAWNENGNLFVSLVNNDATVKSVAFDGQGSVDELVFTKNPETFAADGTYIKVTWNKDAVASMTIGGEEVDNTGSAFVKTIDNTGAALPAIAYSWIGDATHKDGSGSIASGETANLDLTGATSIDVVAKIGDVKYETLAAAVEAAFVKGDVCEIDLVNDLIEDITFSNTAAKVTLDLAGKKLTGKGDELAAVIVNGIVEIKGDGEVVAANSKGAVRTSSTSTDLTISGGTYTGAINKGRGNLTITGGKFSTDINSLLGNDKIAVKGADDYYVVTEAVTVTFVTDKGTAPEAQKIAKGATATEPTAPTAEGWTFKYWYTTDDSVAFNFATVITENTTLTAKWEQDVKPVTVTVSFTSDEAEWVKGGSFPDPTIDFEPTGSYAAGTDYDVAWSGDYPTIEPDSDTQFTCTVTMKGKYSGEGTATFTVKKAQKDWPAIDDDTPIADVPGIGDDVKASGVSAKAVADWATKNGVTFGDTIITDALLLNCANTTTAVDDAKEALTITADDLAALMAGDTDEAIAALKAKYPMAQVEFVDVTKDITGAESSANAKLWRLKLSLPPAKN